MSHPDHAAADRLWSLIKSIRTCMLSTVHAGAIESRPMSAYGKPDENKVFFITRLNTEKTREIGDGDAVNLAFADKSNNDWISIEGHARVVRDEARQKQLWNFFAEAYVPEGPADPNVGLIEVTPTKATLWQGPSWTVTELWKTAIANVLQEEPNTRKEEIALS